MLNLKKKRQRGVSLLETMIYIGIFSVVSIGVVGIFWNTLKVTTNQQAVNEVDENLRQAIAVIGDQVRSSAVIQTATGTDLILRMADFSTTTFTVSDSMLYLTEGSSSSVPILSNKVEVDSLDFRKIEMAGSKGGVRVNLVISYKDNNNPNLVFSKSLLSTVNRAIAITFNEDILPGVNNQYYVGNSSLKWKNGYFAGDVDAIRLCIDGDCKSSWADIGKWVATSTGIYYSSGNVGIGTDNPATELDVNGTITATKFSGSLDSSNFENLPPNANLELFLSFDGSINDLSQNYTNSFSGTLAFEPGIDGLALSGDNTSKNVSLDSTKSYASSDSWSIAFWHKENSDNDTFRFLAGTGGNTNGVGISPGDLPFIRFGDASYVYGSATTRADLHHLVYIYDNGSVSFYVDGEAAGTGSHSSTFDIDIVGRGYSNYYLDGWMDDFRLYNIALSANQVKALYDTRGRSNNSQIAIGGTSGAALSVGSNNYIGIGTNTPSSELEINDSTALARLTIDGEGSSYTQSDILYLVDASLRGGGSYVFNSVDDTTWYWGTMHNLSDAFGINRKAGSSFDSSTASSGNSLLTVKNNGDVEIEGTVIPDNDCGIASAVLTHKDSGQLPSSGFPLEAGGQGNVMACSGTVTAISAQCVTVDVSNYTSFEIAKNGSVQNCDTSNVVSSNIGYSTNSCSVSFAANDIIGCYVKSKFGSPSECTCNVYVRFD